MTRLQAELRRLFDAMATAGAPPNAAPLRLLSADGQVRALVLAVARPAGWNALSAVWRGVQADLELPAPVIAVSGLDSDQLWFSLAQPLPAAEAQAFLRALQARYLAEVAPELVRLLPATDDAQHGPWRHADQVPPLQVAPDRWSAFIAPDLASLFADDPCLDMPPGDEAQADLLSRVVSAKPEAWARAVTRLRESAEAEAAAAEATVRAASPAAEAVPPRHLPEFVWTPAHDDGAPKRFLLAVMNDAAVPMALRIEAAKALLRGIDAKLC